MSVNSQGQSAENEYIRKSRLDRVRRIAMNKKAKKEAMRQEAKERLKKQVKKKATSVALKIFIAIAPYLFILIIAFIAFAGLIYYVCEGGGLVASILRLTSLGNICP